MKHKCPILLKQLATIVQENSQSFCPSEPFRIIHFTMGHPVFLKVLKVRCSRRKMSGFQTVWILKIFRTSRLEMMSGGALLQSIE